MAKVVKPFLSEVTEQDLISIEGRAQGIGGRQRHVSWKDTLSMIKEIRNLWHRMRVLGNKIVQQEAEITRLREGRFTEEEFQNLCHNFSTEDIERFKRGCEEYQKKLFGEKK